MLSIFDFPAENAALLKPLSVPFAAHEVYVARWRPPRHGFQK